MTQKNAMGAAFAYVFDGSKMLVLYLDYFRPERTFEVLADVDLDGPEPDWEAMDPNGCE